MVTATGACGRPPECLYMHLSNFSLFLVDLAGCLYPQTVSVFRIQASQLSTQTAVSADSCILKYPNPWIQLFGSIRKYPSIHEAPGHGAGGGAADAAIAGDDCRPPSAPCRTRIALRPAAARAAKSMPCTRACCTASPPSSCAAQGEGEGLAEARDCPRRGPYAHSAAHARPGRISRMNVTNV